MPARYQQCGKIRCFRQLVFFSLFFRGPICQCNVCYQTNSNLTKISRHKIAFVQFKQEFTYSRSLNNSSIGIFAVECVQCVRSSVNSSICRQHQHRAQRHELELSAQCKQSASSNCRFARRAVVRQHGIENAN